LKPKVLFVIDTLEIGGAEKSMLDMAVYFKGTQLVVCHLYCGDELKSAYQAVGVRVHSLNVSGDYSFYNAYQRLKHVVELERPDILHATLLRASLVSRVLCYVFKIPLIGSWVSDSYGAERYSKIGLLRKLKLFFFQMLDRVTASSVTHFIAISETVAASNASRLRIPPDKVTVLYRGRDFNRFSSRQGSRFAGDQVFQFLTVGRLVQSKGHQYLIRAFCREEMLERSCKLAIVGKGPEYEKLHKFIQESKCQNRIELLGERNNVAELMARADAFLFPSYYEGLGGALIEAMMTGLPVICSDIPTFREFIRDGENGLLAQAGNTETWSKQARWIMDHPEEAALLGKSAQETARIKFDLETISSKYEHLYASVYNRFKIVDGHLRS
jgi:glycosyltransferase involved in cell wall biosynthesis